MLTFAKNQAYGIQKLGNRNRLPNQIYHRIMIIIQIQLKVHMFAKLLNI